MSDESMRGPNADHSKTKIKKNVFVFAAYVPPGKHLIVVRDEDIDTTNKKDGLVVDMHGDSSLN